MAIRRTPVAFRVQKFLAGLHYPASRQQVLERARQQGAGDYLMRMLLALPDRIYDSPITLSREIARQVKILPNDC